MQIFFAKVVTRPNFACESSIFSELFHMNDIIIPEVNLVWSLGLFQICRPTCNARLTCSNCGVLGVNIDPCEYCRLLPQCRKCRRRMPGRCFVKSITPNICEVRHVLSVPALWSFLPLCMNKLVSLYYKLQSVSCRIVMRGSHITKSWERGQHWRARTKN